MLRDDLISLLGWRLGDRDDMRERAIAEMQYAQEYQLEANISGSPKPTRRQLPSGRQGLGLRPTSRLLGLG